MANRLVLPGICVIFFALCIVFAGCTSPLSPGNSPISPAETTPALLTVPSQAIPAAGNFSGREATTVVDANNQFAFDLYTTLRNDPRNQEQNIFFSPFSISSALAITYEGARGNTADEIGAVTHLPVNSTVRRQQFYAIDAGINANGSDYFLRTANALWAEKSYRFLPEYTGTASRWYSANVTNLDFTGQPDASRQIINSWVTDKTGNMIRDLLPAGSIDPMTRLVITNAVYFKGTWAEPFDVNETREADFRVSPGKTVPVQMMQHSGENLWYPYAETADLQMISMPYLPGTGKGLSMVVLLPKDDNPAAAEAALDPRNLTALEHSALTRPVAVYFPKFSIGTGYSLPETLSAMGMPDAFTPASDFSGMDGTRDLYIGDIVHKALVNVDEVGTEAAASTAVVLESKAVSPAPVFRADHPFIFVIQDNDSGAVLFVGRIVNPGGT